MTLGKFTYSDQIIWSKIKMAKMLRTGMNRFQMVHILKSLRNTANLLITIFDKNPFSLNEEIGLRH